MKSGTDSNPFAAPAVRSFEADRPDAGTVPWRRWIVGSTVLVLLVSHSVFILPRTVLRLETQGVFVTFVTGTGLLVASIVAARRYRLKDALLLMQVLNVTVWLTMLATVAIFQPILIDAKLISINWWFFVWVGLSGAAATAVVTGLTGRR